MPSTGSGAYIIDNKLISGPVTVTRNLGEVPAAAAHGLRPAEALGPTAHYSAGIAKTDERVAG